MYNETAPSKTEDGSSHMSNAELVKEICEKLSRKGKLTSYKFILQRTGARRDLGSTATRNAIGKAKDKNYICEKEIVGTQANWYVASKYEHYVDDFSPERPQLHTDIQEAFFLIKEITGEQKVTKQEIMNHIGLKGESEQFNVAFEYIAAKLGWETPSRDNIIRRNDLIVKYIVNDFLQHLNRNPFYCIQSSVDEIIYTAPQNMATSRRVLSGSSKDRTALNTEERLDELYTVTNREYRDECVILEIQCNGIDIAKRIKFSGLDVRNRGTIKHI